MDMDLEKDIQHCGLGHDLLVGIETTARELRLLADELARPYGLSNSRWLVLCILQDKQKALSQKDLAGEIGIEGPTLVRILDGMERDGWVRRRVSEKDRRVKLIDVNEETWEVVTRLSRDFNKLKDFLLDGLAPQSLLTTISVMARLRERVATATGRKVSPLPPPPQE